VTANSKQENDRYG
jgi:hypothetical protein